MADKNPIITVDLNMFSQDAEAKTTEANKVAKSLGISDEALAKVEDFKRALTEHNAWDLPFMGYVNEDGYGYAYVPDAAITMNPYWDAHKEFMNLPEDVQTASPSACYSRIVRSIATARICSCTTTVASK